MPQRCCVIICTKLKKMNKQTYSVSRLKLFQTCPHKYYLRYVLGEQEPTTASPLVLGIAVHKTLEKYAETGGALDPAKFFKDTYDTECSRLAGLGRPIVYGDWDSYKDDITRGSEIVTKYIGKSVSTKTKKIYSEVPFYVEFPSIPNVGFIGVIDGVTEDLEVREYKTTKSEVYPWFIENDLQMNLYAYALKHGKPVKAGAFSVPDPELNFLFGKLPRCVTYIALHSLCSQRKPWQVSRLYYEMVPSEERLSELESTLGGIVRNIKWCEETGIWTKNLKDPTTSPCSSCAFKERCWGAPPVKEETIDQGDDLWSMIANLWED